MFILGSNIPFMAMELLISIFKVRIALWVAKLLKNAAPLPIHLPRMFPMLEFVKGSMYDTLFLLSGFAQGTFFPQLDRDALC